MPSAANRRSKRAGERHKIHNSCRQGKLVSIRHSRANSSPSPFADAVEVDRYCDGRAISPRCLVIGIAHRSLTAKRVELPANVATLGLLRARNVFVSRPALSQQSCSVTVLIARSMLIRLSHTAATTCCPPRKHHRCTRHRHANRSRQRVEKGCQSAPKCVRHFLRHAPLQVAGSPLSKLALPP